MASLRRLRRRKLRWQRYAAKTVFNRRITQPWAYQPPRGFQRAAAAVAHERGMRRWAVPRYDQRCCLAGDACHPGPCVIACDGCNGSNACPECGGLDDLGCWHCDGTGNCPHGCDDGELVLSEWGQR